MPLTLFESDEQSIETTLIEDGYGNYIELPMWGCCSWAEKNAIEKEMESEITGSAQQTNIAAAFLRLRLHEKIKGEYSLEELLSDKKGRPLPEPMIENLYKFAMSEYNRNRPKEQVLTVIGENAKALATQVAKKGGHVVITRSDLEVQNVFYVFRDGSMLDSLNNGSTNKFQIVEDFSFDKTSEKIELGKQPQALTSTSSS
jgi:hypothetical protein